MFQQSSQHSQVWLWALWIIPSMSLWKDVLQVEGALVHSPAFWGHLWHLPSFQQCQGACHAKKWSTLGISFNILQPGVQTVGLLKKNHPSQSGKGRDSWNPKKQTAHLSCVWSSVWEAGGFVHNLILEEMCPRNHSFSIKYNKMKLLNTFPSLSLPSLTLLFAWLTPVPGGSLPHHADVSGSLFEYL